MLRNTINKVVRIFVVTAMTGYGLSDRQYTSCSGGNVVREVSPATLSYVTLRITMHLIRQKFPGYKT